MSAGMGLLSAALGGIKGYGEGVTKSYEAQQEEARQARRDAVLMRQQKALAELGIASQEDMAANSLNQRKKEFDATQSYQKSKDPSGWYRDGNVVTEGERGKMTPDEQSTLLQTEGQAKTQNAAVELNKQVAGEKRAFENQKILNAQLIKRRKQVTALSSGAKLTTQQKLFKDTYTSVRKQLLDEGGMGLADLKQKYGDALKGMSDDDIILLEAQHVYKGQAKAMGLSGGNTGDKTDTGDNGTPVLKSMITPEGKPGFFNPVTGQLLDENMVEIGKATKGKGTKKESKTKRTPEMQKQLDKIIKDLTPKLSDYEKYQKEKEAKAKKKEIANKNIKALGSQPRATPPNYIAVPGLE